MAKTLLEKQSKLELQLKDSLQKQSSVESAWKKSFVDSERKQSSLETAIDSTQQALEARKASMEEALALVARRLEGSLETTVKSLEVGFCKGKWMNMGRWTLG